MTPTKDTSQYDYLRHRPFLIVEMIMRPAPGVRTEHRGWSADASNIRIDDNPYLVTRISDKIMAQATVIIDLLLDRVVKNQQRHKSDDPQAADADLLQLCKSKYADLIRPAIMAYSR